MTGIQKLASDSSDAKQTFADSINWDTKATVEGVIGISQADVAI